MLGTQWLLRVGMVFLLVFLALFLKYAYNNGWIGPLGRLAIGTLASVAAIAAGERFRRRGWMPLFQAMTGGGLAGLYTCIFFSFRIYEFSGQTAAMALATLVTLLAVALAVLHDAMPIAVMALIGGFLSPVLLSTGENHPYGLFLYVVVLDLVALGAAWFRRWRALDLLALAGTVVLYQGWYLKFGHFGRFGAGLAEGEPSQALPALLFASVFYVLFLIIPILNHLARRTPVKADGLALLAVNAVFWLSRYYDILYWTNRQALGFVVLGQAVLMFAAFSALRRRVTEDRRGAESLLTIGLALVFLAVPIQLHLYGVPIAWALEGWLFAFLGRRYGNVLLRVAGVVGLVLAGGALLGHFPLHVQIFTPVWNRAFGSWMLVAVAAFGAAWTLGRNGKSEDPVKRPADIAPLVGVAFAIGFVVASLALSLETYLVWTLDLVQMAIREQATGKPPVVMALGFLLAAAGMYLGFLLVRRTAPTRGRDRIVVSLVCSAVVCAMTFLPMFETMPRDSGLSFGWASTHATTSLIVLWTALALGSLQVARRRNYAVPSVAWTAVCHLVLALLWLVGLTDYGLPGAQWLGLNWVFPFRLLPVLLLIWEGERVAREKSPEIGVAVTVLAQAALAILLAVEITAWRSGTTLVSERMAIALISAAWGAQACALIVAGLVRRRRCLRLTGFALFGVTVAKVLLYDTKELTEVQRMVSFLACGALLVLAGYFYQRFSAVLLQERAVASPDRKDSASENGE